MTSHGHTFQTLVLMACSETPAFRILPRARPEARGKSSLRIVRGSVLFERREEWSESVCGKLDCIF